MNTEQIRDQWNSVTGRLRDHWSELSDNDFRRVRGNAEQLVGMVQKRTGATRAEVEQLINRVVSDGNRLSSQMGDAASRYASDASEYLHDHYDVLAKRAGDYSHKAVKAVRARPTEALVVAFSLGVIATAIAFMKSRRA